MLAHPASPHVAALLGVINAYAGVVEAPGTIRVRALKLAAPTGEIPTGSKITWSVRPADVALNGTGPHRATVLDVVTLGAAAELTVELDALELTVRTPKPAPAHSGAEIRLDLPAEAITVWAADGNG